MADQDLEQTVQISEMHFSQILAEAQTFVKDHPSLSLPAEEYIKYFYNKLEMLGLSLYSAIKKETAVPEQKNLPGADLIFSLLTPDKTNAMKELLFYTAVTGELLSIRLRDKTFRSINYDRFRNSAGQNQVYLFLKHIKAID